MVLELLLDDGQLRLALLDAVAERAHGGDRLVGVAAGLLDGGDLVAGALALGAHGLDVGEQAAPLLLDREELVERRRRGGAPPLQSACGPRRGCERTIFTSSIVTPRGRERGRAGPSRRSLRRQWYRTRSTP